MNESQISQLGNQYKLYLNTAKSLIAEVEAYFERCPLELFNEIRAFNDHIARSFAEGVNETYINDQMKSAKGHMQRLLLDCYKNVNLYFHDKIEKFEKRIKRIDVAKINNGQFFPEYDRLHRDVIQKVRHAKTMETKDIPSEEKYMNYESSANAYKSLSTFIDDNSARILNAKIKFWGLKSFKVLITIGTLILGAVIAELLHPIITDVLNLPK